jgi:hypothetical protein
MKPVYVATDYHEKQLQRALLQYNRPQNADLVREALTKAGREDLIGYGEECLVRPAGGGGHYPKQDMARNAGRSRNDGKKASAVQKASSRPQRESKANPKADQRPQKPSYKAGWAKPKAKKSGKKK